MVYKNKKTGNVIDISCELRGDDWEKLDASPKTSTKKKAVKKNEAVCDNN